jgi:hypothetical protein
MHRRRKLVLEDALVKSRMLNLREASVDDATTGLNGNQLAPCDRKSIRGELSSASMFRDISMSVCATGMPGAHAGILLPRIVRSESYRKPLPSALRFSARHRPCL